MSALEKSMTRRCVRYTLSNMKLAAALLVAVQCAESNLNAGTIKQHFPADQPVEKAETCWRVDWGIIEHDTQSEILYIKQAFFKTSPDAPWLKVLGDCRLVEVFVPYNFGKRYYDITGGPSRDYQYKLTPIVQDDLGPACIASPEILEGKVAKELHDERTLWITNVGKRKSRRAQAMHVWAVLRAWNYKYIMMYVFHDDGRVTFQAAATAHNYYSSKREKYTHLHTMCWRINVALGDAANNSIKHVRYVTSESEANGKTEVSDFRSGTEGAIVWRPEEFTSLRIVSKTLKNQHEPEANAISYDLIPIRFGNARNYGTNEDFTHYDIWVTRRKRMEMRFYELPKYVRDKESLDNHPSTIWYQSSFVHRPRDEDFGKKGYSRDAGVAISAWTGIELKPRDLFSNTPLYP